jgi:hypothetical protein
MHWGRMFTAAAIRHIIFFCRRQLLSGVGIVHDGRVGGIVDDADIAQFGRSLAFLRGVVDIFDSLELGEGINDRSLRGKFLHSVPNLQDTF